MKTIFGLAVAVALAGAVGSTPARAIDVTFTGFTDGCFGLGCAPLSNSGTQTVVLPGSGLTYTNSTFSVTSAAGFASIGSSAGTPNVDNLGSFTLSGAPFTYTGNIFDLLVTFTAPPGTTPNSTLITDQITGTVTSTDNGGIFANFDNTPVHFTFAGGSFDFFVNDVSVTSGRTISLSGTILEPASAVPEPSTWAMMLIGFVGLGFAFRQSRRKVPA